MLQASPRACLAVFAGLSVAVAVACSAPAASSLEGTDPTQTNDQTSTKPPTTTTTTTAPPAATTPTPAPTATTDAGTPPTATPGDGATCAASSNHDPDACFTCCSGGNAAAEKVFDDKLQSCTCGAGGRCASRCAQFCQSGSTNDIDQACGFCLDRDDTCNQQADDACKADATCAATSTCMDTCMGP